MQEGEPPPDNVIPFRRPARKKPEQPERPKCTCGAMWRNGFSSDPAWLVTAPKVADSFIGLTHCQGCGRKKLDVLFGRDTRFD